MASPVKVTISGTMENPPGVGDPQINIHFRRRFFAAHPSGTVIEPGTESATVDADGDFSIQLISNNDPAWIYWGGSPYYEITIVSDRVLHRYEGMVPYDTPGGQMTLPVDASGIPVTPAVWAAVNHTHIQYVTQDELDDALEGAGAVLSVNGQTGVVVLNAASVGADPAGAAASVQFTANAAYDKAVAAETVANAALPKAGGTVTGTLGVSGYTGLNGGAGVTGDLNVSGQVTYGGATVTGDNVVNGYTSLKGTGITGDLAITGGLSVTGVVTGIDKTDVGLANVDNTSDANKPVSAATTTALGLKANLASPTFTGTPAAPTAAAATNTTQVATTAFVQGKVPVVTNVTTPGTSNYVDPGATCKYLDVTIISPGGGGGSGRRGAAGTVRAGGSSGGSGGFAHVTIPYSSVTFPVSMTLGTAGTGGAAQTTNDTDGNAGTGGNGANFGTYLRVGTTGGGSGGGTALGTGGFSAAGQTYGQNGAAASASGGVPGNPSSYPASATSGGAGGGITVGDSPSNGGAGAAGMNSAVAAGGIVGGATPGTGAAQSANSALPGNGGGGGAASITAAAQAGASGGIYGAAGGGGGASLNGFASGAGGNGANGIIQIIAVF